MTDVDVRTLTRRVQVADGIARLFEDDTVVREMEIRPLPEQFVQWQLDYKRRIYDAMGFVTLETTVTYRRPRG